MPILTEQERLSGVAQGLIHLMRIWMAQDSLDDHDLPEVIAEFNPAIDEREYGDLLQVIKHDLMEKMQGFQEPPERTQDEALRLLQWRKIEQYVRPFWRQFQRTANGLAG